jgi:hypothetical protein
MARCATCTRDAVLRITGRIPQRTLYSASTCDAHAKQHRAAAKKAAGDTTVLEEPFDTGQEPLF